MYPLILILIRTSDYICLLKVRDTNESLTNRNYMVEELNIEIQRICNDLIEEAQTIAQLSTVSHLSTSKLQFSGGLLGGIQEYREKKRLEKLMNAPICKGWTFFTYAFHLIDTAEDLVEKQIEVQNSTTEDDDCYFGNVKLIVSSITFAHNAWFEYSPDMAWEGINVGDTKNVALELSVDTYTKEEFRKLHLPEGMSFPVEQRGNGGCMSFIIMLLIPTIALIHII